MINYNNYLESKQVGILYHFTNLVSLYYILQCDCLESDRQVVDFENLIKSYNIDSDKEDMNYISFTRNKNLNITNSINFDHYLNTRLTFDGNKISNNYKIYKANYFNDSILKESEELILVKYSFNDISKYLLKIEIPSLKEFINEIEFGNMQYYFKLDNLSRYFGLEKYYEYNDDELFIVKNDNFYKILYDNILNSPFFNYDNILK